MTARTYRRDQKGWFAATPGQKVASALAEAEAALNRAEQGIAEIAEARAAQAKAHRRTTRRHALAGAAVGALVPAPAGVRASATASALFTASTTTAGYKVGKTVGRVQATRQSVAGRKVTR